MWVYLRAWYATQWPCPDGFHIPITDDADTIRSIYFTLDDICDEINGEMLREHAGRSGVEELFLIPPLWYVNYDWWDAKWEYRGSNGRTWLAEYPWCTNPLPDDCEWTALRRSYPGTDNNDAICTRTWMPIRPFKDVSVPPEDSWSALVDMTNDVRDYYRQEYEDPTRDGLDYLAWIFWKEDLWLVTISDWFNYMTIADKNLWAEAVRLGGDSKLTDAYYGDIFQRWNNFAFTSDENWQLWYWEEAIDASWYWPGNYYSSSTYVWRVEDPVEACEWDSSHNTNLRWWDVWNAPAQKELKNAYIWEYVPPYLCFTANTAGSTVQLKKFGSPTSVTLETSTDWVNWTTYTIWDTITLSNIWDFVFFRNTSETDTLFSLWYSSNFYSFVMTGSIAWSWDVSYLLNKNWTDTLGWDCIFACLFRNCNVLTTPPELKFTTLTDSCYCAMFDGCTALTSCPSIPATTIASYCCKDMFYGCSNLETLPELPATTFMMECYREMFYWCTKIKLSASQTWEYQTAYRVPTTWTWTTASNSFLDMFTNTWWTKTWTILMNTTYYTSNTVV